MQTILDDFNAQFEAMVDALPPPSSSSELTQDTFLGMGPFTAHNIGSVSTLAIGYLCKALMPGAQCIREGLGAMLPLPLLRLAGSLTLERTACGPLTLDLTALKRTARVIGWATPTHPTPTMFWEVLGEMSVEEQEGVLKFVFAMRRLPTDNPPLLTLARMERDSPDTSLPMGHTCVGQLDLPNYSSKQAMRAALLKACALCSSFDLDGGTQPPTD